MTNRQGLICFRSEEHAEAVKNFREALLVRPQDLTTRSNLGNALLKSKKFETAQDEFARVLKLAPGNIDALLGAAQVSIELADDGDPDQYKVAELHLNNALKHGRNQNQESGSKYLGKIENANIYYMRGYVRTKSYEAGASRIVSTPLINALHNFQQCRKLDPYNRKSPAAIAKIIRLLPRRGSELWVNVIGPFFIFIAGAAVFLFAQLKFFSQNWQPSQSSVTGGATSLVTGIATEYGLVTFGAHLFMVAGLSLPRVLKLKVGSVILEKAAVDQVSAPSTLGISRSESLIK